MMKGARGPDMNQAVLAVVQAAQAGTPLMTAWKDADKPCSRANIYKAFKSVDARTVVPAPPKPRAPRASAAPVPEVRKKPPKPAFILNPKQAERARQQKADQWSAFVAAHREATVEYAKSVSTGKTTRHGHRALDIAARHSKGLAAHTITARALQEWYRKGKPAGAAPRKRGPKADPKVQVLVDVVKSHAKMQQLDGNSLRPVELSALVKAATTGTPLEPKTQSGAQVKKLLRRTREGDNRLSSRKGENIASNRSDWLTEGNVAHSFNGWETFLVVRGFGEWKTHPETKTKRVYVPQCKRRRIVQPDETHQIMTTALEAGGPRAHVYSDPELGASGRSTVVNSRHTSAMCAAHPHALSLPSPPPHSSPGRWAPLAGLANSTAPTPARTHAPLAHLPDPLDVLLAPICLRPQVRH